MATMIFFILLTTAIINDVTYGEFGHAAALGEYKYAAAVWYGGELDCNGAIISTRHILTAGHCIYGKAVDNFRVSAGVVQISNSTIWRQVQNAYYHPGYQTVQPGSSLPDNDIGILKLRNALVFSDTIQPISLSTDSGHQYRLRCTLVLFRNRATASIHQVNASLRWSSVVVTERRDCATFFRTLFTNQMCILNPYKTRTPIRGDSGAPTICGGKVFGVLNSGLVSDPGPTKILMVAPYRNWIQNILVD